MRDIPQLLRVAAISPAHPHRRQLLKDSANEIEVQYARIAELERALRNVIGMLDDPTGGEHVRDMRGATVIARTALKKEPKP